VCARARVGARVRAARMRALGASPILILSGQVHRCLRSAAPAPSLTPDRATLAALLAETSLDTCEPLVRALPHRLFHGASGASSAAPESLSEFVDEIAELAARNPLLCKLARRLGVEHLRLEGLDAEIYRLVHYCLLLHLVTGAVTEDPALAEQVYCHMRHAVRSRPNWHSALNWFEVAKLTTVDITLERFAEHRLRRQPLPPNFGHIGLPFNILEAVLQDSRRGHHHNAAAGLALSAARPGSAGAASISDDHRCAVQMRLPQPIMWKNMYVSWNMCFTTAYADAPYFGAALLAPCVLGAKPHEFMFYRTFALHLHISTAILQRDVLGRASLRDPILSTYDWRDARVSRVWGGLNCEEAHRFEQRLRLLPRIVPLIKSARRCRRRVGKVWESSRLNLPRMAWPAVPMRVLAASSRRAGPVAAATMATLAIAAGATASS